ncbi:hypothetical protein R3W88_031119 [Solanum pinnatisectum]|uniref:Uncharacterized protein n=1 Tax=Solanum pinnatisectum TaxID=50273 RepID=A0AAV9LKG6_9SOLN|nr:hypothetical protein R3W88_031119 [Solanum pinnatisectum]
MYTFMRSMTPLGLDQFMMPMLYLSFSSILCASSIPLTDVELVQDCKEFYYNQLRNKRKQEECYCYSSVLIHMTLFPFWDVPKIFDHSTYGTTFKTEIHSSY